MLRGANVSWLLLGSISGRSVRLMVVVLSAVSAIVAGAGSPSALAASGIHKIAHVVIIMQENRSFDSYFGTYPGADGIPMQGDRFAVCVPDPLRGGCERPYHDPHLVNLWGPHENAAFLTDLDGGLMDGFIRARQTCTNVLDPQDCLKSIQPDVMGYHDAREIPNYWAYAHRFVLQDHMFEPVASWSLPAPPVPRLGVVSPLSDDRRPDELHEQHRDPRAAE